MPLVEGDRFMARLQHSTVLSALATSGHLSKRGEVLAVAGLAFLLKGTHREEAFRELIGQRTGVDLPNTLTWEPELRQEDNARPDLVGCDENGMRRVVIEAKILAALDENQLRSYAANLRGSGETGVLIALVPEPRRTEASAASKRLDVATAVISWDELLDAIEAHDTAFRDVAQLRSMCDALGALDVSPLKSLDPQHLRERLPDLMRICDRTTIALTPENEARLPSQPRNGGWYRYFPTGDKGDYASLGVAPVPKFESERLIWLRWWRQWLRSQSVDELAARLTSRTATLEEIDAVLECTQDSVWVGVQPRPGVGGSSMVDDLIQQTTRICELAGLPAQKR